MLLNLFIKEKKRNAPERGILATSSLLFFERTKSEEFSLLMFSLSLVLQEQTMNYNKIKEREARVHQDK